MGPLYFFKLFLDRNPITNNGVGGVEYLKHGVDELVKLIDQITDRYQDWTEKQQMRAGIAAWDCGPYQILSNTLIDYYTVGMDFSSDIFSRAQYFAQNGY